MAVPFPQGVPLRSAPGMSEYPVLQPRSGMTGDIGEAAQEFSGDVNKYADRQQQIEKMVYNRQFAQQVQAAKEEWQRSEMEFSKAKEDEATRQFEQTETRRTGEFDAQQSLRDSAETRAVEKATREKEEIQTYKDANSELFALRSQREKDGQKFTKADAENIFEAHGITGTVRADRMIERWFPRPYQPRAARAKKADTVEEAQRSIPFRESELQKSLDELAKLTGTDYTASRVIKSDFSIDFELKKIPQEMRKQADLLSIKKDIRAKMRDVNNARIKAGESYNPGGSSDMRTITNEIQRLKDKKIEQEKILEQLEQ